MDKSPIVSRFFQYLQTLGGRKLSLILQIKRECSKITINSIEIQVSSASVLSEGQGQLFKSIILVPLYLYKLLCSESFPRSLLYFVSVVVYSYEKYNFCHASCLSAFIFDAHFYQNALIRLFKSVKLITGSWICQSGRIHSGWQLI